MPEHHDAMALAIQTGDSEDFEFIPSPTYTRLYANTVNLSFSPWDMKLTFADTIGKKKDGKIALDARVTISVPLQTAKALADLLIKHIAAYEQTAGVELRVNPLQPTVEDDEKPSGQEQNSPEAP